jgi:hypothetical protein
MAPPVMRTLLRKPLVYSRFPWGLFFGLAPFHVNVKTDDAQLIYEAKL